MSNARFRLKPALIVLGLGSVAALPARADLTGTVTRSATFVSGQIGVDPDTVTIARIQGAGHISPLNGQTVTNVPGIVSVVTSSGFYMQDPIGDGNPATSEGIFIHTGHAPSVTAGTPVLVSGQVSEYRRGGVATNLTITEIAGSVTVTPTSGLFGGATLHPVLLGIGGRRFPTEVVDNDTNGSLENPAQTRFDPAEDGIDFLESLEGMWVQVHDAQAVSPTNRYGEIYIVADGGAAATHMNSRGGITLTADDANPERLQMDDALMGARSPQVTVGTRFGTLTGVIDYDYGSYQFLPTTPVTPLPHELPRAVARIPAGANDLSVASFNVENLDPKVEDRARVRSDADVDDDVGSGKFAAIADYIVQRAARPDIVALQEVQDNDGAENDGVVAADQTLNLLVQDIVQAGGPQYAWAQVDPVNLAEGGQPGGNIRVAFLYNPARVSLAPSQHGAGGSTTATRVVAGDQGPSLSYNPGRINPASKAWSGSRVSLVAQFRFHGRDVFIINNHFTSKGGSSPEFGVRQPMVNGGVGQRTAQATEVYGFVNSLLAADAAARVLVLGDMNEFGWNVPLETLRGELPGQTRILTDLADLLLPESERYSYVFQGNSEELDHMLVSDGLKDVARFEVLHVNSEFPDQISDHDPARAVFTFDAPARPTERLAAYIDAFNSGSPERMREFFQAHYAAAALAETSLETRLARYPTSRARLGAFAIDEILAERADETFALGHAEKGGRLLFRARVDKEAPHKLLFIFVEMVSDPQDIILPDPKPDRVAFAAAVRTFLEGEARADRFSGVVLAARGNDVLFHEAYGFADRERKIPNRKDTKFNLGSINKSFTRAAVLRLAKQGKLSLEDPIGETLPDYPNAEAARKVTIRHLLDMTSGIGDFFGPRYDATPKEKIRTIADYLPLFADRPLEFEPGTNRRYSNGGFIVLGAIIEKVSGTDYYTYVKENIFEPCGMTDTDSYESRQGVANLALGYTRAGGPGSALVVNNATLPMRGSSAGGGYSTAGDMLKYVLALGEGKIFLPEIGNGMAIAGGAPGINAYVEWDPRTGYVVVVLTNLDPPAAEQAGRRIVSWLPE